MPRRPFIHKAHKLRAGGDWPIREYRVFKETPTSRQAREKTYGEGYVEPKIDPLILLSLLELNSQHSSACTIKANDIIKSGYTVTGDDAGRVEEFLGACKPSFEVTLQRSLEDLQVFNYCALEVVRDTSGAPVYLEYVPAHTVRVHESREKYLQRVGNERVYFKDYRAEGEISYKTGESTEAVDERANELIFISLPSSLCSYYGVPRYVSAIPAILALEKVNAYNYSFFSNHRVPSYAITITGDFEDELELDANGEPTGRTILQSLIEENFDYIAENPHTPIVLSVPGGDKVRVEFVPLSDTEREASFLSYEREKKLEIAAAHMMDPYRIGIFEVGALGGNLAEATAKNYVETVIRPQRHLIATILTDFFQTRLGEDGGRLDVTFAFNDEPLIGSEVTKNYTLLLASGVLTPREVRERLFELKDGPDVFIAPGGGVKSAFKGKGRGREKRQVNRIRGVYEKYRGRFEEILESGGDVEAKKRLIDETVELFKKEAYNEGLMEVREAHDRGLRRAIRSGSTHIPADAPNLSKYEEQLRVSVEDMGERIRHYMYKAIGWGEL